MADFYSEPPAPPGAPPGCGMDSVGPLDTPARLGPAGPALQGRLHGRAHVRTHPSGLGPAADRRGGGPGRAQSASLAAPPARPRPHEWGRGCRRRRGPPSTSSGPTGRATDRWSRAAGPARGAGGREWARGSWGHCGRRSRAGPGWGWIERVLRAGGGRGAPRARPQQQEVDFGRVRQRVQSEEGGRQAEGLEECRGCIEASPGITLHRALAPADRCLLQVPAGLQRTGFSSPAPPRCAPGRRNERPKPSKTALEPL